MKQLLQLHSVCKKYGTFAALDNVSLDIHQGEIFALLGANGAGKTTLSSIIASLHPATSGSIIYNDRSIYDNLIAYRRILGFCPQQPNFSHKMSIRSVLEFAGRYYQMPYDQIQKRIKELVDQFHLEQYIDAIPDILSGGYKQRLMIARSLMHRPALVILDEPTVALDPHIRRQLWDYIKGLKKDGITVLLTTHYLDEAEVLADRVCVLHKGTVRLIDTPSNLMASYNKNRLEDVFVQLMHEETEAGSCNPKIG